MRFRLARDADVAAVVELVESAYRGERSLQGWTSEAALLGGQRTDPIEVGEAMTGKGSAVLLAETGDGVVGCCRVMSSDGGRVAEFGMFAVRPELQAHGVGRQLLEEAERHAAREQGAVTMQMHVIRQRVELIAWYERLGYRRTGEVSPFPYGDERFGVPRRDDLEFVVLEKELPPPPGT